MKMLWVLLLTCLTAGITIWRQTRPLNGRRNKRSSRSLPKGKWRHNSFVQAYRKMFGDAVVCYPSQSVAELFHPIPDPNPIKHLVHFTDTPKEVCKTPNCSPIQNVTHPINFPQNNIATCMEGGGKKISRLPILLDWKGYGCAQVKLEGNEECITKVPRH